MVGESAWKTSLGTPASGKWDEEWLAEVERVEGKLGRRICGAHTPAWTPCKLSSSHVNGRCRFHGGAPGIGAPGGNRNAWVHGLYSRRLQQCGEHCPLWERCPMAGRDVLELALAERPHCVYEREEYEGLVSSFSLEKEKVEPKEIDVGGAVDGVDGKASVGLVEGNVALFQVMLTRAQAALSVSRMVDETRASSSSKNYRFETTRVGALVQAQLWIARELRAWLKMLPGFGGGRGKGREETAVPPPAPEGLPMRMARLLKETEGFLDEALELKPGEVNPFRPGAGFYPPKGAPV